MGSSATVSLSRAPQSGSALVWGCIGDSLGRRRIQSALRGYADIEWFQSFGEMRRGLEQARRDVGVVLVDMEDSTGAAAHVFVKRMADTFPAVGIIAYRHPRSDSQADLCRLAAAGIHDILLAGLTDEGYTARRIILDARRRGVADVVISEITAILPPRLHSFAEAVVRYPENSSIAAVTRHLSVHRQTPNFWCKRERYPRPEELLIWCRLFLVSALLERTPRTLDAIANELDYASPTVVRNQLRRYTSLTATQIRGAGLAKVLDVFAERVEAVKASGVPGPRVRSLTIE